MEGETSAPPTYKVFRDQHGIPQFSPKRGTQALKDALIYTFPALETELQLMQAALRQFFDSERTTQLQFVCELPENSLQASLAKKRDVPISPLESTKGVAALRNWKLPATPRTTSRPTSRPSSRASSRGRSRASSRAPSRAETPAQGTVLEPLVEIRTNGGGIMTTWQVSNGLELEKRKRQPYDPVKRRKVAENRGNACEKHRASKTACDPDDCPLNKLYSKPVDHAAKASCTLRGRVSQASLSGINSTTIPGTPDVHGLISGDVKDFGTTSQTTDTPSVNGSDIFWDSFESYNLQAKSSILSFADMASNSDSGYWTDNDPTPWVPRSDYPGFSESSLEGNASKAVENATNNPTYVPPRAASNLFTPTDSKLGEQHVDDARGMAPPPLDQSEPSNEILYPAFDPLLIESPAALSTSPFPGGSDEALMTSQDPFMGSWASEKAHHLFDDYGWVLHHVENL